MQEGTEDLTRIVMSIRIRPDIKQEIQELAKADRRTTSSYIEMVLESHIRELKKKPAAKQDDEENASEGQGDADPPKEKISKRRGKNEK